MAGCIRQLPRASEVSHFSTDELRDAFVIDPLSSPASMQLTFTDMDRMVVGSARPGQEPLALPESPETGSAFFLERRELGAINIGGRGRVIVDNTAYTVNELAAIYVGKGAKKVTFESADPKRPAEFFILSCPAHQVYPHAVVTRDECRVLSLGAKATANERKIHQMIHPDGMKSCQLVMGFTELAEGSVWNTMPPHTHSRRCEVYCYFDLHGQVVVHLMGEPKATRHLIMHEKQVVLSPSWSIHSGCGTGAYRFIWGMAGENQIFSDMDHVALSDLR